MVADPLRLLLRDAGLPELGLGLAGETSNLFWSEKILPISGRVYLSIMLLPFPAGFAYYRAQTPVQTPRTHSSKHSIWSDPVFILTSHAAALESASISSSSVKYDANSRWFL